VQVNKGPCDPLSPSEVLPGTLSRPPNGLVSVGRSLSRDDAVIASLFCDGEPSADRPARAGAHHDRVTRSDVRPATAEADARSLCADVMHGIGSVSRLWRCLAKGVLTDELAWLRVRDAAAAAECLSCFPRALSVRIVGDARAGDIGAVLGSRSVMRLALETNNVMRGCEGLGQLVGLRALYIEEKQERRRWRRASQE
jgi:hypothetical protein